MGSTPLKLSFRWPSAHQFNDGDFGPRGMPISGEVLERCVKPVEDDLFTRREMFEICDDGQRVAFNYNDLFLRPIRHWNPERVKGHVFLCMLSYMIIFEAR